MSDEDRAAIDSAIGRLNPIESWVIRERYSIHGRRTYAELSTDCGQSPRRVRQIERMAMEKLCDLIDSVVLAR